MYLQAAYCPCSCWMSSECAFWMVTLVMVLMSHADDGVNITAALDQRPFSERALRFLSVTAAGLLQLAAWQTQTLQVDVTNNSLTSLRCTCS